MNATLNKKVNFQDLGQVAYEEAWNFQEKIFKEVIDLKIANRGKTFDEQQITPNYLFFCEHPHVYTLGKSGDEKHLLANPQALEKINAQFYRINRGGDITYHGPGQIVGYPILDLDNFFTDIHRYLRTLEEAVIRLLASYGLKGERVEGLTGVWLDGDDPEKARKICALGVRASRWVTMHGFALNVNIDLNYFNYIVPCGIENKKVTSLAHELGEELDLEEVKSRLLQQLKELFAMELVVTAPN